MRHAGTLIGLQARNELQIALSYTCSTGRQCYNLSLRTLCIWQALVQHRHPTNLLLLLARSTPGGWVEAPKSEAVQQQQL